MGLEGVEGCGMVPQSNLVGVMWVLADIEKHEADAERDTSSGQCTEHNVEVRL